MQVLKNFLNDLFVHDEVQAQKEAKEFEAKVRRGRRHLQVAS